MRQGNNRGGLRSPCQTELDAVLVALAHPYRRYLLKYLDEPEREVTVTELAAVISQGAGPDALPGSEPRGIDTVETSLYHIHVPKLAEIDVVEFDPGEGTVLLTERWEEVRPIVQAAEHLAQGSE